MIYDLDSNGADEFSSQLSISYCQYHYHDDHHPHVIARYNSTIVTTVSREQESDRTVAAQKKEQR